jgi:hypothetical protein
VTVEHCWQSLGDLHDSYGPHIKNRKICMGFLEIIKDFLVSQSMEKSTFRNYKSVFGLITLTPKKTLLECSVLQGIA